MKLPTLCLEVIAEMDCDQTHNCGIEKADLLTVLQKTLEQETDLLRTYTLTSERIHDNEQLKIRLQNFAEGNAKRSKQLIDEVSALKE